MTNAGQFRTSSFYAAAFLFTKGLELVNIERSATRRSEFVFRDDKKREEWMRDFSFASTDSPKVAVDVHKFITAIKMLKEKLYQES